MIYFGHRTVRHLGAGRDAQSQFSSEAGPDSEGPFCSGVAFPELQHRPLAHGDGPLVRPALRCGSSGCGEYRRAIRLAGRTDSSVAPDGVRFHLAVVVPRSHDAQHFRAGHQHVFPVPGWTPLRIRGRLSRSRHLHACLGIRPGAGPTVPGIRASSAGNGRLSRGNRQPGYEWAATSLFMWHGMPYHALAHTRTMHDRYHGSKRNPWNEVEWGSHYSRSMATSTPPDSLSLSISYLEIPEVDTALRLGRLDVPE